MDLITGIINVFTPSYLAYCLLGCILGTLVGVLPGLGPASALSILLPLTTYLDPTGAIIMLAGLFYGVQYGGSTTSILVNIPGEASSVVTCLDGFQMTRQGRAGQALWIAAVGSFIAGTLGVLVTTFIGPGLALYGLRFGPPEYLGLFLLSMTTVVSLSGASITRGMAVGVVGMILAASGTDPLTGTERFTFGSTNLLLGLELIPLVVGLFGISEILVSAEAGVTKIYAGKLGKMMPRGKDLKNGILASLRGSLVGLPLGLLPGVTSVLSSFLAYDLEKRVSKYPEKMGTGLIEGVAAPEAANNATAQTNFIPLMVLGIPTSASMAILLSAFMLYGISPGPLLFQTNKEFVWTVIGSMYVGNVMLLILNLPLVGLWARMSQIPYKYLGPVILAICVIGSYSPRNSMLDVWVALGAGVVGFIMNKAKVPITPFILGFILGPMIELSLRQSLSMAGPIIFLQRPVFIILLAITIVVTLVSFMFYRKKPALREENN
jgi:putative tricarboxylic transport membrane protein